MASIRLSLRLWTLNHGRRTVQTGWWCWASIQLPHSSKAACSKQSFSDVITRNDVKPFAEWHHHLYDNGCHHRISGVRQKMHAVIAKLVQQQHTDRKIEVSARQYPALWQTRRHFEWRFWQRSGRHSRRVRCEAAPPGDIANWPDAPTSHSQSNHLRHEQLWNTHSTTALRTGKMHFRDDT